MGGGRGNFHGGKLTPQKFGWSGVLKGNMGLSILTKSQLSYSIPESMLRLNKFEKIVPKMGKMKIKWEDFKLYQCSKKEKPLIHLKDCHKYL